MHTIPFSVERAARLPPGPSHSRLTGLRFRSGRLLDFEASCSEYAVEPSRSLRWDANAVEPRRVGSCQALSLNAPSYTVADGGTCVMLTHVLRHSPVGLRWRSSLGESARLEPGAIFVSQGLQDALVELVPDSRDDVCECITVMLRADWPRDLSILQDPLDFPFCNCSAACVRVMLGEYQGHVGQLPPLARLTALDIDLVPFAEIELPMTAGCFGLAILTSGSLQLGSGLVEPLPAIVFRGHEPSARLATQEGASLLWLELPNPIAAR